MITGTPAPLLQHLIHKWGFWEVGQIISLLIKPERAVGMNQTYLRSEDMEIQKIRLLYAEGEEVSRAAKNPKMITASALFVLQAIFD